MKAKVETITPTRAADLLEKADALKANPRNRIWTATAQMERAIAEERWEKNGESIKINGSGEVVDGQHRLAACVSAGMPFTTVVVYGVDDVLHVDQGRKRRAGQVLPFRTGVRFGTICSGIVKRLLAEKVLGYVGAGGGNYQSDIEEEVNFTLAHKALVEESASVGSACRPICSGVGAGVAYYKAITRSKAREQAEQFFGSLASEETIPRSPAHVAYRRCIREIRQHKKLDMNDSMALLIKAFNATLLGETPRVFLLRKRDQSRWTRDTFPTILTHKQWTDKRK